MNAPLKRTILGGTEKVQARGFTSLVWSRDSTSTATKCRTYLSRRDLCILDPFYVKIVYVMDDGISANANATHRSTRVPPRITLRAMMLLIDKKPNGEGPDSIDCL